MNYTQQLEQLLTEILNEVEDDPIRGWITDDSVGEPFPVSNTLSDLLDRAMYLIYSVEEDIGYPTEEGE